MKKTHLIIAVLAAITLAGTVPVQAATLKEKAAQRFNDSINRFRSCIRGKCTKMQAAKLLRDVTIAATAVIAAMYGIGKALEESALDRRWDERQRQGPGKPGTSIQLRYDAGRTLSAPGRAIGAGAKAIGKAVKK